MNENLLIKDFNGDIYKHATNISTAVAKNIGIVDEPLRISVSLWQSRNLCNEFLSQYGDKRSSLDLDYHIVNYDDAENNTVIIDSIRTSLLELGLRIEVLHTTQSSILIKINPISFILQTSLLVDNLNAFLKNPKQNKLNWFVNIDEVIEYIINSTYINICNNTYEFDVILSNDKRRQTSSSNDVVISFDKSLTTNTFKFCEIICSKLNSVFEGRIEYKHISNDVNFSTDTIHVKVLKECEK